MTRTITRLFDHHTQALSAVEDLERAGVPHKDISIVSNNSDKWHDGHRHPGGARADAGPLGDRNGDGENDVADGAGKGAATGGVLGGGAGLLAGLGMLAIPGLGPVVAAGWLASTAAGAVAGAAIGGATGGLLGALKEAGHSDEEANVYSEGVRRGGTLISVRADDSHAARIEEILHGRQGVDASARGQAYREQGWSRFDAEAAPYTSDEIATERSRYAEGRSFAHDGTSRAETDDLGRGLGTSRPGPAAGRDI
ncbi:MAG: hypothetical protein ACK41C_19305 [Phenylobacterium sp.]|uniref:hypothetical protein n=1 Tax=Phenylobacterium sp. TaxID=1871053 RepID=UPI00391A43BE